MSTSAIYRNLSRGKLFKDDGEVTTFTAEDLIEERVEYFNTEREGDGEEHGGFETHRDEVRHLRIADDHSGCLSCFLEAIYFSLC